MRTIVIAVFLTLAFSVSASAQKCKEYSAPAGSFAFCPPEGWTTKQDPKSKKTSFEGPDRKDTMGAVLAVDEDTVPVDRNLLAYQLIQAELVAEGYSNPRLIVARDIETTTGVKGTTLVFFLEMNEVPFVQVFYIFDGPKNVKITFTLTGPQDDKELGNIVSTALKTLRLKK